MTAFAQQLVDTFEVSQRNNEYASCIELCNKILADEPKQAEALDVLLFSLLQSELYADALKVAARVTARDTTLERAYALYCTQRFAEAIRTIDDASSAATPLLRLKAQAQYRLGDFAASAESYGKLCDLTEKTANSEKDAELYVNALATFLSKGDLAAVESLRPKLEGISNSELAFNFGTALLQSDGLDNIKAAEAQLVRARDLCEASCKRYRYSEADTTAELAPIVVQLAYAWQRLGRVAEAKAAYTSVLKAKPNDPVVVAVASNNLIALRGPDDSVGVFDSLKRSKVALGLSRHLSSHQLRAVSLNHCILLLSAKNTKACERYLQSISDKFGDDERYAMVRASLLYRAGKAHKANNSLQSFADAHPDASLRARLQLAQQYLSSGKKVAGAEQVAAAVNGDEKLRFSLGVVSTLVSIHESRNDGAAALQVLRDAVDFWAKKQKAGESGVAHIVNVLRSASAKLQSQLGHVEEAAAEFQALAQGISTGNSDAERQHRADLIIALSYVEPKQAASLASDPSFIREAAIDTTSVDVDAVLSGFLAYQPRSKAATASSPTASDANEAAALQAAIAARRAATIKKRRLKRRKQLREQYIAKLKEEGKYKEDSRPDEERWLPRRLRKKTGGRRRGRGGGGYKGGAQGAGDVSGRDSDKYDLAAQVKAGTTGGSNSKSTANTQARGSSGSARKNRKKKRGKKKK